MRSSLIGQGYGMTSFRKNFKMKNLIEADTRLMMRMLLLPSRQRSASSKILLVESLPLKMERREP
jgi:hypothetical protein